MLSAGDLLSEITFTTSRSSGPGGQHVNKVDSKVTLRFDVKNSELLSESQRNRILAQLSTRISAGGVLVMSSQATRSQLDNKKKVLERFDKLLAKALTIPKKRKKTRPSKSAMEKRLKEKKVLAEKKDRRRKI
ncbi:MAG TPA: aminoacyl-tRNA hydrolase [Flavobacteriales bacterium]|nr:aminoacyl-tRNA hydrolase [Flavobacteriales bacterium]